ncbi:MAG: hypothetical protein AAGH64_12615 [Planctomycetota bacterium]
MNILSDSIAGESMTGHISLAAERKTDPHATRFGKFLQACIKFDASDLIIKTGASPKIRLRGSLKPLDTEPVTHEEYMEICRNILTPQQFEDLNKYGSVDFAYDYDATNRFRVNLFQARERLVAS